MVDDLATDDQEPSPSAAYWLVRARPPAYRCFRSMRKDGKVIAWFFACARWGRQRPVISMSRRIMPGWKSRCRGYCSVLPK